MLVNRFSFWCSAALLIGVSIVNEERSDCEVGPILEASLNFQFVSSVPIGDVPVSLSSEAAADGSEVDVEVPSSVEGPAKEAAVMPDSERLPVWELPMEHRCSGSVHSCGGQWNDFKTVRADAAMSGFEYWIACFKGIQSLSSLHSVSVAIPGLTLMRVPS